jgi:hypothetical protein
MKVAKLKLCFIFLFGLYLKAKIYSIERFMEQTSLGSISFEMPLNFYKYNPLDKNKDTLYRFAGIQT